MPMIGVQLTEAEIEAVIGGWDSPDDAESAARQAGFTIAQTDGASSIIWDGTGEWGYRNDGTHAYAVKVSGS